MAGGLVVLAYAVIKSERVNRAIVAPPLNEAPAPGRADVRHQDEADADRGGGHPLEPGANGQVSAEALYPSEALGGQPAVPTPSTPSPGQPAARSTVG